MLTGDRSYLDEVHKQHDKVNQTVEMAVGVARFQENKDRLREIGTLNDDFERVLKPYFADGNDFDLAFANAQIFPLAYDMRDKADALAERQQVVLAEVSADNHDKVDIVTKVVLSISTFAVIAAIVLGLTISIMLSRPIIKITDAVTVVAKGDLTIEDIVVKNRDETGILATSFNQMVHSLKNLIQQAQLNSEQVAASAEELLASAEMTNSATETITTSIQEIANGSELQLQSIEETAQGIHEMSTGIQIIAQNSNSVHVKATESTEKAVDGNRTITSAVEQMNSINSSIGQLSTVIAGLGEQSKQIGLIVQVISDIAAQTNLLALNAAIEAARAGEQGRGFAVVADEVRKLAEQSSGSAEQISLLISSIQSETNKAIESMQATTTEVKGGITLVHRAGVAFGEIQTSIDEVSKQIGDVSAAAEQISASTEEMVATIDTVASIAEQASSSTQNVSSSTEEQLASMQEITASATALTKMAEELQLLVGQFKI